MSGKTFRPELRLSKNPAENIIGGVQGTDDSTATVPTVKKDIAPGLSLKIVENKTRRLQLLVRPSLHTKIKSVATAHKISVNEAINAALESIFFGK